MQSQKKTSACLDHLVVGVSQLESGAAAFERISGMRVPTGGQHPLMGTHNCLTQLGNGAYLELISIDSSMLAPQRRRWYSLDSKDTQALLMRGPTLLTWVVAVTDLDAALAAARELGVDAGRVVEQRRDDLRWHLSVRDDGCGAVDGLFPTLIQWPDGVDAAARMPDLGARLDHMQISHPDPSGFGQALAAVGAEQLVELVEGPMALTASMVVNGQLLEMRSGKPVIA